MPRPRTDLLIPSPVLYHFLYPDSFLFSSSYIHHHRLYFISILLLQMREKIRRLFHANSEIREATDKQFCFFVYSYFVMVHSRGNNRAFSVIASRVSWLRTRDGEQEEKVSQRETENTKGRQKLLGCVAPRLRSFSPAASHFHVDVVVASMMATFETAKRFEFPDSRTHRDTIVSSGVESLTLFFWDVLYSYQR